MTTGKMRSLRVPTFDVKDQNTPDPHAFEKIWGNLERYDYASFARMMFEVEQLPPSPVRIYGADNSKYTWEDIRAAYMQYGHMSVPIMGDITAHPIRMAARRFHRKYPGIANGLTVVHPKEKSILKMISYWKYCHVAQIDLSKIPYLEYKGSESALAHILDDMPHIETLTLQTPYFGSALCEKILTNLPNLQTLTFKNMEVQGDVGLTMLASTSHTLSFEVGFESIVIRSTRQAETLRRAFQLS